MSVPTDFQTDELPTAMFNQAFYTKVEVILASLHDAETVSVLLLGRCMSGLKACLVEAEVDPEVVVQFTDIILDLYAAAPSVSGGRFAAELRHLLDAIPGLSGRYSERAWSDALPGMAPGQSTCAYQWDMKELANRMGGSNRATLQRLRMAMGPMSERRVFGAVSLRRGRFVAGGGMKISDLHDARIDSEQVNRLIRYLDRGEDGKGPDGGRPAVLG